MSFQFASFAHLIESDGPGGAERMLASVAAALQAAGSRNVIIVPAAGEGWLARELSGTGVQLETFQLDRPLSPAFAGRLETTFRKHGVTLAHSHEFTMAVYGAWAARRAGVPHLFTMHGGRYYAERLRRRIALRVAAEMSGATVAVSEMLARHLSQDLWLGPARITTIPNGARGSVGGRSSLRSELALGSDTQVVVAVGNLYPVKGHRYLLEALGLLRSRLPRLHVAIAGRGELEGELRARAEALGVGHRFHLLGLRSDIGNVLAGADVVVLPSLSEGVPLALLEAMLAARPIIASAVGEVPTVLDRGNAGVLVSPGDAAALANALEALLSDPARAQRLSLAAAARANGEYSFERMMERYIALYAKLLGTLSPAATHSSDPLLEAKQIGGGKTAVRRQGA
jgi:glycosyltransferase involved in cell wall biosynthesis